MAERGVEIDHATLNRWVVKFSPLIAENAQDRKRSTAISWWMDESYNKDRGKWTYQYHAVVRDGQTLDFMSSERRDTAAARKFFKQVVGTDGVPDRIALDKSDANLAGLQSLNDTLKFTNTGRIIRRITRPMLGFKSFHSAAATFAGIEAANMIRKGQVGPTRISPFTQFDALAE